MGLIQVRQYNIGNPRSGSSKATSKISEHIAREETNQQEANHLVIGTPIQDPNTVQITSEWASFENSVDLLRDPQYQTVASKMDSHYGHPATIFHIPVPATSSAFGENGPGTASAVEYVLSFFPSSRATPEFQKNIESDFARFDDLICERAEGHVGLVTGWVEEEQECESLDDEKAKCYFVMRGWETMGHFEQLMKQDWVHESALPILLAWKVESKMWHVENKVRHV